MVAVDVPWYDLAICQEHDPEIFWTSDTNRHVARRKAAEARAICLTCPVRFECLEDQLAYEARSNLSKDFMFGIFGGLTPTERLAILRQRGQR